LHVARGLGVFAGAVGREGGGAPVAFFVLVVFQPNESRRDPVIVVAGNPANGADSLVVAAKADALAAVLGVRRFTVTGFLVRVFGEAVVRLVRRVFVDLIFAVLNDAFVFGRVDRFGFVLGVLDGPFRRLLRRRRLRD